MNRWLRSSYLLTEEGIELLQSKTVAVFGLGGVGSYVVEAIVRTGIGKVLLIDHDTVSISNINRQLIALHTTIGQYKTEVAKKRIQEINPSCIVETYPIFVDENSIYTIPLETVDYMVDAIDTITAKIVLIKQAFSLGVPIISSMGAGNRLDPMKFQVAPLKKTHSCPLAKVMRLELRKLGLDDVKVVFSTETPMKPMIHRLDTKEVKKTPIGSVSFVPSAAGLLLAKEVILELINRG